MVRTIYPCDYCNAGYYNEQALFNHCDKENDYYSSYHEPDRPAFGCNLCNLWWRDEECCLDHMRDEGHFGFECRVCYHWSWTKEARVQHEHEAHFFCKACDRSFQSHNNLKQVCQCVFDDQPNKAIIHGYTHTFNPRNTTNISHQHLNSRTHLGQDIKCPFCPNSYTTATGMTHHLESGSCRNAPSLNRDSIYKFVRSKDPSGLISKKLIGWDGSSSTQNTYSCTDRAWNGRNWECYLCHKGFNSMHGLNQHLNSPAHQQNLYHCPNRNCRQDFKTLAAIINHLESEKCGAMRFEQVQRGIHGMVSGSRLIGY